MTDPPWDTGCRLIHFWIQPVPNDTEPALCMQYESVGIRIGQPQAILIPPTVAADILNRLLAVPGAVRVDGGVTLQVSE